MSAFVIISAFLLMIFIPFVFGRSKSINSLESFTVSDRNFGWFRLLAGLSTTYIGGAAIVNLSSLSYTNGFYAYADVLPTVFALVFSGVVLVKKISPQSGLTLGAFLSTESSSLRLVTGLLGTIVYTIISSAQILALTRILEPYVPINSIILTLLIGGLVGAYIIFMGYWAVTFTDVIQFILISLGFILFFLISVSFVEMKPLSVAIEPTPMKLDRVLTLALPLLFIPISQDLHVRIHSAKSSRNAIAGTVGAALVYLVVGTISILIGKLAAEQGISVSHPDQIISSFLDVNFGALAIIPTLAILAVVISTLDSTIFSASNSLGADLMSSLVPDERKDELWIARGAAIMVVLMSTFLALFADRILELVLSALLIYVSVLFPVLVARVLNVSESKITWIAVLFLIIVTLIEAFGIHFSFKVFILTAIHSLFYLIPEKPLKNGPDKVFNRR